MTMTATEENVKHDQSLVDILARCVMLLGILVAQGQKGGPLTMREYVQVSWICCRWRKGHMQCIRAAGLAWSGRAVCSVPQVDGASGTCCVTCRAP